MSVSCPTSAAASPRRHRCWPRARSARSRRSCRARSPASVFRSAISLRSSRRSAFRAFASGPWQVKQFSDRIGRMSALKWTAAGPSARADEETSHRAKARPATQQTIRRIPSRQVGMTRGRTGDCGGGIRSLRSHNRAVSVEEGSNSLIIPCEGPAVQPHFFSKIGDTRTNAALARN